MSEELNQRVVDLEKRVHELEEAQASYVMRGEVNANAQCSSEAISEIITSEIDKSVKSLRLQRSV